MKASVVREFGKGWAVEDVNLASPVGQEVLIDVKASGLCHSDVLAMERNIGFDVPSLLGHEVAGVIAEVGPDVKGLKVGDHVVACTVQSCGACSQCLTGKVRLCENMMASKRQDGSHRITDAEGHPVTQGMDTGGFAQQTLIHESQLAMVPKELPFPQASLLGCGVVTGVGAVLNTAKVEAGETVAILGAGGVGLNGISGAVIAGASMIIVVDVSDEKLENAKKFGATHTINSTKVDPVEEVKKITGGGVNHAFDFVGGFGVSQQGYDMLARGGGLYLVGVIEEGNTIEMESLDAVMTQRHVHGVYMGFTTPKQDIPMLAELYLQGRFELDALVSKEIRLDEVNEGFAALKDPSLNRVVITDFDI